MNNKQNTNETLSRMKELMGYGLQTESKKTPYSSVENQKLGADGNVYGIVREGTHYYIKVASNKANLVKEDFNYIGGFRNRKDYQYDSFANAQKQFDLKMMSLKEAANNKDYNISSWDLDKKENVVIEATDKMKNELSRSRQIMENAMKIAEGKKECPNGICDVDIKKSQKDNISSSVEECGDAASANAGYTNAEIPANMTEGETCPKCGKNPCQCETVNEEEVLGWNRGNDDYMDKSHGTEIGDSAPFDDAEARNIDDGDKKVSQTGEMKNGTVEEGASMHDSDNQNTPTPGTGEIGDDQPFDGEKGRQIDEALDDFGGEEVDGAPAPEEGEGEPIGDDLGAEGEEDVLGDDLGAEDGEEFGGEEDLANDGGEEDVYEDDVESRLDAMEEILSQIADKLGIGAPSVDAEAYGDDDIFGDEDDDEFGDEEEPIDDDMPMENRRRGGVQIYETKSFRNAMRRQRMNEDGMKPFKDAGRVPSGNMNKLDDFGKHPAYQKKVMELPPKDMKEFPGYYDMNDDSVRNDTPYGEKIGDGAPFDIDPQAIDNAIAESFNRLMRNKKKI